MPDMKRAASLCKQQKFDEAIAVYTEIIEKERSAEVFYQRGKAYFFLKSYDKSIADLTSAIALNPGSAHYVGERGLCYHMMGKHEEAMSDFDKAVEMEAQNPFRYASRAFIKDRAGDLKGAVKDYQKALELDPEDAISYNNLGIVLEKAGNKKAAERSFAKADELDPSKAHGKDKEKNTETSNVALADTKPRHKASRAGIRAGAIRKREVLKALLKDKEERKEFWRFVKAYFRKP